MRYSLQFILIFTLFSGPIFSFAQTMAQCDKGKIKSSLFLLYRKPRPVMKETFGHLLLGLEVKTSSAPTSFLVLDYSFSNPYLEIENVLVSKEWDLGDFLFALTQSFQNKVKRTSTLTTFGEKSFEQNYTSADYEHYAICVHQDPQKLDELLKNETSQYRVNRLNENATTKLKMFLTNVLGLDTASTDTTLRSAEDLELQELEKLWLKGPVYFFSNEVRALLENHPILIRMGVPEKLNNKSEYLRFKSNMKLAISRAFPETEFEEGFHHYYFSDEVTKPLLKLDEKIFLPQNLIDVLLSNGEIVLNYK